MPRCLTNNKGGTMFKFTIHFLMILLLISISQNFAQTVEPIGGPYTPDSTTVLLLHFEGDYTNSSTLSGDAYPHGNATFFDLSATTELGKSLYLVNGATSDSSWVNVDDNDNLDLDESFTIEAWFNIQTFGENNQDHRWVPSILWKPGFPTFDQGNYFMEVWGDTRRLSTGFSVAGHGWPSVQSPDNMIQPGNWYHATLIRDFENSVVIQMIHDPSGNLVWSGWSEFDPETQAMPNITSRPIYIGFNGGSGVQSSFLDGFVDEVRISNVVRNFAIPPVITNVTVLENQDKNATEYPPIKARVPQIGGATVQDVFLNYRAGNGDWQQVAMNNVAADTFQTTIPVQAPGNIIYYYIEATNSEGQRSVYPINAENAETPELLTFAVEEPNTRTLALEFENGSGNPVDSSTYGHQVSMSGLPTYEMVAAKGAYSMLFHKDSHDYLEINTPVVGSSEEFSMEFWMKPVTMDPYWGFIVNKPAIQPGYWGENTFEIIWNAWDDPGRKLTAGKFTAGEQTRITLDYSLEMGKWYHVIYEIRKAPEGDAFNYYLMFQINDSTDTPVASDYAGFNLPPDQTPYPMRIGEAAGRGEYYDGYIDAFHTYNYAINKVVVNAPPNVSVIDPLPNQTTDATEYPVQALVTKGLGADISSVKLYYSTGNDWQSLDMTNQGNDTYSATIPKQDAQTVVYYYVVAENADGLQAADPVEALNEIEPVYHSFAVEVPQTKVLELDFEESSGTPQDKSDYNTMVKVVGSEPVYSDDAANGAKSIELNGTDQIVEVYTPLLGTSEEWTVDFWFNANDLNGFWRFLVNKPAISVPFWGENTFEIITGAWDDPTPRLTGGLWSREEGNTRITLNTELQLNTWYHVIFEVRKAEASAEKNYIAQLILMDKDGNILESGEAGFNIIPTTTPYPLRLGKAGGDRPYFNGKFDDFKVYNYAAYTTDIGDEEQGKTVLSYSLAQNYPNPFNPTTEIKFSIAKSSRVTLTIYDLLGRKVKTLVNSNLNAGLHKVTWNGTNESGKKVGSGLYLYRIESDNFVKTKKMVLLK